jgi:5'-methylthioadenosine phosphorylase
MVGIPAAELALIGGSGTFSINFPEDIAFPAVTLLKKELKFQTPFGESPPFKLFEIKDVARVYYSRMHGWRSGVSRADASRQIFWVFKEAGVKKIISEGGVGAINKQLKVQDLVVPEDYLDFSLRRDVSLGSQYLLIMRRGLCPSLRRVMAEVANDFFNKKSQRQIVAHGIYAVTDGQHFESPAEVRMLAKLGADVVGQSLCPEVYLAREIGACYAGIYLVVNMAEGVEEWQHEELKTLFYSQAPLMGRLLLKILSQIKLVKDCDCAELRKETLLKEDASRG